ncbi:unnamed protein product [Hermetia illucens]|uniref:Uncharacterized protein n=1 Tax=Hermetia illucens TaxID=343691 RepID=A0A7R8YLZ0_HERIL|nr:unnamed protein product [Hermetia illucens]
MKLDAPEIYTFTSNPSYASYFTKRGMVVQGKRKEIIPAATFLIAESSDQVGASRDVVWREDMGNVERYHGYNQILTGAKNGLKKVLATSLSKENRIYDSYTKYITTMNYTIMAPLVLAMLLISIEGVFFIINHSQEWTLQRQDPMVGDGLYVMWSFITLGTLWIYYWHADEISVKSDGITNALYTFNWYEAPLSLRKDIAIFMGASMRTITLKSFFIRINTSSLFTILKTSYSYFTLLQNFAK